MMERTEVNNKEVEFSIIGAGRFGLFWGDHLSRNFPVSFYDVNPSREKYVTNLGSWVPLEECLNKDYIFITIPIRRMENFIRDNSSIIKPGSVIIDCASIKLAVQEWFNKYLPEEVYFASCHPLFGPDSAKLELQGQKITSQPGRIPYCKYQFLVDLMSEKLKLEVLSITADEHDRLMAFNLSLIHHLGRTFNDLHIYKLSLMMAGLKKISEISDVVMNDSTELFHDFYRFNPYAGEVENKFLEIFKNLSPNSIASEKIT
jgi:prephenate dehydrogenase